ncbi:MAG: hypothetical protein HY906_19635 [Deltaproteobacteria bacterium]|nr:hypothetical protein [Deltaproteobacteria bacterium]
MVNKQERCLALMKEILRERFLDLAMVGYELREDFDASEARIVCRVRDVRTGETQVIEGQGVGIIDAFFHGLKARLAGRYKSLDTIRFSGFTVRGKMDTGRAPASSDALAEVTLGIRNSYGAEFAFTHASRSVTRSGLEATLSAAEYFVNSEVAFLAIHDALRDARAKHREDLVTTYTAMLAVLVENTSYSDVLEQKRQEL